ncbi:hypothetical protein LIER_33116 [Lithospermum erythrorhizon]|uniref:Uncharacterized protein n=1 Tax=Lithospermum erythrorhizon TaxID=34254 RepID=A0AAV3RXH6_LITER
MELDFDKYCVVDASPNTVLPSPRTRSKVERRISRSNSKCENDVLSLDADDGFREIRLHRYRSASCKNVSSSKTMLEDIASLRRGSVYQCSKERQIRKDDGVEGRKKIDAIEGRRKIEVSRGSATAFSYGIVESLCSSDEDNSLEKQQRSQVKSQFSVLSSAKTSNPLAKSKYRKHLDLSIPPIPESCLDSDGHKNKHPPKPESMAVHDCSITSTAINGPLEKGNGRTESHPFIQLNKSLSAKLAMPHSPARSESDSSRTSSPKARFTPIRRMFDPFVKSKSLKNSLISEEHGKEIPDEISSICQNKTFQKSLFQDFSRMETSLGADCQPVSKESPYVQSSPAHLQGFLKLENKHGVPFFKFESKFPEEMLVAKTWKVKDSSTWIYTFHSVQNKRKSSASGRGPKDSKREVSMVGQMQVSCYLCKQLKESDRDKFMVTEFVLYDTARLRKSVSSQDNCTSLPDVAKVCPASDENTNGCDSDEISARTKVNGQSNSARSSSHFSPSPIYPLPAVELHPDLESAAVVIQVPFEKRESLNIKTGDGKIDQLPNLLDRSEVGQRAQSTPESSSSVQVNVVIPSGNHGLPMTETCGPSSLLERWRLGGSCDCGGWDMACPLHVFNNSNVMVSQKCCPLGHRSPFKLYFQGKKGSAPALTMMATEGGHYAVDFHAQLSALQAFSICISILHTIEASSVVGVERDKELLQCDSLRVFVEDEIKFLIDAVMQEEKCKVTKKMEDVLPSFIVNPPFSPISRV